VATRGLELLKGGLREPGVRTGGAEPGEQPSARPAKSSSTQRVHIVDGALRCIARQGVAKTTLDDVAREAHCSRATVYRVFPGGKDGVLCAVVETEVSRFFSALAITMGEAADLEDVLVAGMTEAARRINDHAALALLLENEPQVVLPHLAFSQMDTVLAISSAFTAPFLGRWLDHRESERIAEWAARIVISYLACPAEGMDLTDPKIVRHFVARFVLPGVRSQSEQGSRAARASAAAVSTRQRSKYKVGASQRGRASDRSKGEAS
jgi:AcrR family transcriptional regulator